ncbi:MAG: hypothetical protein AAFU79_03530, partial [Myxococcota bacterium]
LNREDALRVLLLLDKVEFGTLENVFYHGTHEDPVEVAVRPFRQGLPELPLTCEDCERSVLLEDLFVEPRLRVA